MLAGVGVLARLMLAVWASCGGDGPGDETRAGAT